MIKIIDYGMGNLYSITNALRKVGADARIVDDPADIGDADGVVIPGVGAFDEAMKRLAPYRERLLELSDEGTPLLGICLGMQVLFDWGEEGRCDGLGILEGRVEQIRGDLVVPQMGWNELEIKKNCRVLDGVFDGDFFYFVHSYHCVPKDRDIIAATVDYGGEIAAVVSRDNIFAVQFHPEKSGKKGLTILENFIDKSRC